MDGSELTQPHHIGTTVVDCRHVFDEIPQHFTHGMMSMAHELARIDRVVHQPGLVSIGPLEHLHVHEDVIGRFRDNDEGCERRLVATDGTEATFLVVNPRLVVGFAAHVG